VFEEANLLMMDYKSIVFREFTRESLERIQRYREEENERVERLDEDKVMNKISIGFKREPNKDLAVGETLPRILQNKFPDELIGKPIEEIDSFYRGESVCFIFFVHLFSI
jgi:hypothetical protein